MTKDEILSASLSQLNEWVDEKIMFERDEWLPLEKWSSDMAAAWELAQRMHSDYSLELRFEGHYFNTDFLVEAKFGGIQTEFVSAATAPEAICKAALICLEVQRDETEA